MLRVRQYNKRFFTLDFDSQTFYYAHEAESHKVSSVIPFADLLDVKLNGAQACVGDNVSECSRPSKTSLVRRMSSFARRDEDQDQRSVSIVFKPAKSMELLCSTFFEAERWFEAFQDAMQCTSSSSPGDDKGRDEGPHFPGSVVAAKPAADAGSSNVGGASDLTHDSVAAHAIGGDGIVPNVKGVEGIGEDEPDTPPVKKSFLDFSAIQQEDTFAVEAPQRDDSSKDLDLVCSAGVISLQAEDFGFGKDEQASSGCDTSSRGSSPRASAPTTDGHTGFEAGKSQTAAAGQQESLYQDRHVGLTMQERLANLNFSDDEDEDES